MDRSAAGRASVFFTPEFLPPWFDTQCSKTREGSQQCMLLRLLCCVIGGRNAGENALHLQLAGERFAHGVLQRGGGRHFQKDGVTTQCRVCSADGVCESHWFPCLACPVPRGQILDGNG